MEKLDNIIIDFGRSGDLMELRKKILSLFVDIHFDSLKIIQEKINSLEKDLMMLDSESEHYGVIEYVIMELRDLENKFEDKYYDAKR